MMKQENKIKGYKFEQMAQKYLKKKKYQILATNEANFCGEIDIIAKQKKTIVFVEVKGRETAEFGMPFEAVTEYKQNKIRLAAQSYLKSQKLLDKCDVRFDVISILGDEIQHITNAF